MERDALARHLGISLDEVGPGFARASLRVTPPLLNGKGVTHGGAIFTLADIVFAAASNIHGPTALGLNVNISYMKATFEGQTLTAVAREHKKTRKVGFYRMEVLDEEEDLVAVAEGIVYRK
ncbi:hotdog fold thioesterase [Heliobacterium undosum]|uniref:Hotdog fold thioesterase n=2 Tax=Heliomicrobium undosum TaxID=121734 RepID=A0A845KZN9_9FIRM|nr:hotdog fold thioesterase [Heliomicrobium undosum]